MGMGSKKEMVRGGVLGNGKVKSKKGGQQHGGEILYIPYLHINPVLLCKF